MRGETSAGRSHVRANLSTKHRDESVRLFTEVPPLASTARNCHSYERERVFIVDQLSAVFYHRLMAPPTVVKAVAIATHRENIVVKITTQFL